VAGSCKDGYEPSGAVRSGKILDREKERILKNVSSVERCLFILRIY
jgi:hypothetical protein